MRVAWLVNLRTSIEIDARRIISFPSGAEACGGVGPLASPAVPWTFALRLGWIFCIGSPAGDFAVGQTHEVGPVEL